MTTMFVTVAEATISNDTISGQESSTLNVTSSPSIPPPSIDMTVTALIGTLAALHLFAICVGANVFIVISLRMRSRRRQSTSGGGNGKSNSTCRWTSSSNNGNMNNTNNNNNIRNVEMLVTLIAGVGLINGSGISAAQIISHLFGSWMFSDTFCKLTGMASNLMTLLVIWYEALFSFERYLKFAKPQDYQVTFSKINMQIIALGILLVLMSAVCGPIYGWGTYTYARDVHMCELNLQAPNAATYFVLSTASYVIPPYAIMVYFCSALLLTNIHRDQFAASIQQQQDGWNSLERRKIVLPLTISVTASFLLQLPKYLLQTTMALNLLAHSNGADQQLIASEVHESELIRYFGCWMHTFAVNGCFACVLLLFHGCKCCCYSCSCGGSRSICCFRGHRKRPRPPTSSIKSSCKKDMSRSAGRVDVEMVIASSASSNDGHHDHQNGLNNLWSWCWPLLSSSASSSARPTRQQNSKPIVLLNRVSVPIETRPTSENTHSPFRLN